MIGAPQVYAYHTISQHDLHNLIGKIVSYIIHIRIIEKQDGYKAKYIIAFG